MSVVIITSCSSLEELNRPKLFDPEGATPTVGRLIWYHLRIIFALPDGRAAAASVLAQVNLGTTAAADALPAATSPCWMTHSPEIWATHHLVGTAVR